MNNAVENQIINYMYPAKSLITIDNLTPRVRNTLDAWLKFGTVFLVYRICTYFFFDRENPNAKFFESDSVKLVLYILLGFTLYYMVIKPYIPVNMQHPVIRNLTNDMLMFGTVLVTSHVLETAMDHGQYFNKQWLKTAGIILLSFAAYDIIINPFIPYEKMKPRAALLVHDLTKYGLFLVFFRLLQGKSILDQKWMFSVLFVLLGFTAYQTITKRIIKVQ